MSSMGSGAYTHASFQLEEDQYAMLSKSKDAGHQVALTGPLDTTGSGENENEKMQDGTYHVTRRRRREILHSKISNE
jgi:hypothetical protein